MGFFLFEPLMDSLAALFLSYICALVGGLIWEFIENINLVDMKRNKRTDSPVNSLIDVLLVFLGAILGAFTYDLWVPYWYINIVIIVSLIVAYGIGRIITEKDLLRRK